MKLKPTKKTIYESKLVVRGGGEFPWDMLRYDSCVPYSETDSGLLGHGPRREVTLKRKAANPGPATAMRWQSFGWEVVSEEPTS